MEHVPSALCSSEHSHSRTVFIFITIFACVSGFISLFMCLSGHSLQGQQKGNDHFWAVDLSKQHPKQHPNSSELLKSSDKVLNLLARARVGGRTNPTVLARYPGRLQRSQRQVVSPGCAGVGTSPCSFLKPSLAGALSPILHTRP